MSMKSLLAEGSNEWVLNPATKYVLYLKNVGANANIHALNINWGECEAVYS